MFICFLFFASKVFLIYRIYLLNTVYYYFNSLNQRSNKCCHSFWYENLS